jgi:hypothetical protein
LIVISLFGVVSGVVAAVSAWGWGAGVAGAATTGCCAFAVEALAFEAAVFALAAVFASGVGFFGAKKYDHPKSTINDSTPAIKKRY